MINETEAADNSSEITGNITIEVHALSKYFMKDGCLDDYGQAFMNTFFSSWKLDVVITTWGLYVGFILLNNMLKIPNPDTRLGKRIWFVWSGAVVVQSICSFLTICLFCYAIVTFSTDYNSCSLNLGKIKRIHMVFAGVFLFHPLTILNFAILLLYIQLLSAVKRPWKITEHSYLNDDFAWILYILLGGLYTAAGILLMILTCVVFIFVFLPISIGFAFVFGIFWLFLRLLYSLTANCGDRSGFEKMISEVHQSLSFHIFLLAWENGKCVWHEDYDELVTKWFFWVVSLVFCISQPFFYGSLLAFYMYAEKENATLLIQEIYQDNIHVSIEFLFIDFTFENLLLLARKIIEFQIETADLILLAEGLLSLNVILGFMRGLISCCYSIIACLSFVSPAISNHNLQAMRMRAYPKSPSPNVL